MKVKFLFAKGKLRIYTIPSQRSFLIRRTVDSEKQGLKRMSI